ncbi:MAG: helix-turn-helix domain-containing protein [Patescibacteria group bacterium]
MDLDVIKSSLQELGLERDEIEVYSNYLLNKDINISRMCKDIGINRMRAYQILEKLIEMRILQRIGAKSTKVIASSPFIIVELLDRKQKNFKSKSEELSSILPKIIDSFYTGSNLPQIKIYQGVTAFESLLDNILDELPVGTTYLGLFEGNLIVDMLGEKFAKAWIKKRISKKITARVIAYEDMKQIIKNDDDKEFLRDFKYIPQTDEKIGTLTILEDKVIYWNFVKAEAVLIENNEMNEFFRSIFYLIWNSIK